MLVELCDGLRVLEGEPCPQELPEERWVLVAVRLPGHRTDEGVRTTQEGEHAVTASGLGQGLEQPDRHLVGNAAAQEHLAHVLRLRGQHLADQEVADCSSRAAESSHRAVHVPLGSEEAAREHEAGSPPVRPLDHGGDLIVGELDVRPREELLRLVEREAQVVGADLGQGSREAVSVERQDRVGASEEDQSHGVARLLHEAVHLSVQLGMRSLPTFVDDQHNRSRGASEPTSKATEPFRVGGSRRCAVGGNPDGGVQTSGHAAPERGGRGARPLDRHPCHGTGRCAELDPARQQDRLAASGGGAHQRHPTAGHGLVQQSYEARAHHRARRHAVPRRIAAAAGLLRPLRA